MNKKKIAELKSLRAEALTNAQNAFVENDMAAYETEFAKVEDYNKKIVQANLESEAGRFEEGEEDFTPINRASEKEEVENMNDLTKVLSSKEYERAFAQAIRKGVTIDNIATKGPEFAPLSNALKIYEETTGEKTDEGFLVPEDMQTKINEFRRELIQLSNYVNIENTSVPTGTRIVDNAPTKGFTKIDGELKPVPMDDEPIFGQLAYKVDTYGLIIPISRQLLDDSDVNLLSYLARWFAKKQVITENQLIFDNMNASTNVATATGYIEGIKTALNKTLNPALRAGAKIFVSQHVYNELDLLAADDGRPLLQPMVTDPTRFTVSGFEIVMLPAEPLGDAAESALVFVGNLPQHTALFKRKGLELDSTAIGGEAWRNYGFEVRGITRLGVGTFDEKALVKITVTPGV